MLTREENDLITQTGPGTPAGRFHRRYWNPVALSEELPHGSPPKPVRLLSEDLVLFRDDAGRPGLLARHCSHRQADLSFGRLEDGGIRCVYHGWLYDINGQCLDQPAESASSTFKDRIQHPAYPCVEMGGVILTYMGPDKPPLPPRYSFLVVPEDKRTCNKVYQECNFLQGLEGEIDPSHISYLHKFIREDAQSRSAQSSNVPGASTTANALVSRDVAPRVEAEETDFGVRLWALRITDDGRTYVRMNNFVYPSIGIFSGNRPRGDGYSVNWHVPIDDHHHWKFSFGHTIVEPLDIERLEYSRQDRDVLPDYTLRRNGSNRYLQDREEMVSRSFIGLGPNFNVHDAMATEGQGFIEDRTREHLAPGDKAIALARKVTIQAIRHMMETGEVPLDIRRPEDNRFPLMGGYVTVLEKGEDWREAWKELEKFQEITFA